MNKCSNCGELTTKGNLCLECIWKEAQERDKANQSRSLSISSEHAKVTPQATSQKATKSESEDPAPRIPPRSRRGVDDELLIALDELVGLQKEQNRWAKSTAAAVNGILIFLLISALAVFVVWMAVRETLSGAFDPSSYSL